MRRREVGGMMSKRMAKVANRKTVRESVDYSSVFRGGALGAVAPPFPQSKYIS